MKCKKATLFSFNELKNLNKTNYRKIINTKNNFEFFYRSKYSSFSSYFSPLLSNVFFSILWINMKNKNTFIKYSCFFFNNFPPLNFITNLIECRRCQINEILQTNRIYRFQRNPTFLWESD